MNETAATPLAGRPERRLGRSFRRVGWLGFWLQIVLCLLPVAIGTVLYTASPDAGMPGGRLALISTMTMAVLVILLVTTALFFYYTRVGRRLEAGTSRWTVPRLKGLVRFGLAASGLSVFCASLIMVWETTYMLRTFLEVPQGGVPVIQTTMQDATWISALDVLSLLTLAVSIAVEILILGLGLWLMYWLMRAAYTAAPAVSAEPAPVAVTKQAA